jgi:tyrosyl-tRNA synthetase
MGGAQLYGLTAPLLLDSSGQKMGKTSTGERVWLDAERTSPYAFYQYFFNVSDDDAPRLLRLFSLRSLAELDEVTRAHDADRSQRHAQRVLAQTLTTWVHGAEETARVEEASRIMFGGSLDGVHERTLELLAKVVPVVDIDPTELENGIAIVDLLSRTVAESKSAARRLLQQGGAYINNVRVADGERKVSTADLATPTMLVVRGGRKDYRLVRTAISRVPK